MANTTADSATTTSSLFYHRRRRGVGHAATATAAAAAAAAAAARWRIGAAAAAGVARNGRPATGIALARHGRRFPSGWHFNVKKRGKGRDEPKVPLFDIKRSGTRALFHLVCVRFCILPTHATGNLQLHAGLAHQQQDKRHRQQPRGRSKSIRKHCVLDFLLAREACWHAAPSRCACSRTAPRPAPNRRCIHASSALGPLPVAHSRFQRRAHLRKPWRHRLILGKAATSATKQAAWQTNTAFFASCGVGLQLYMSTSARRARRVAQSAEPLPMVKRRCYH